MIKAPELRIGNRVLYKPYANKDGEFVTIAGLLGMKAYFNKHSNESGMFHHLEPISLTEEWLERMGFEEKENINSDGDERSWSQLFIQGGRNYFTYYWGKLELHDGDIDLSHIRYVHQLQNLYFALTGEELIIKL